MFSSFTLDFSEIYNYICNSKLLFLVNINKSWVRVGVVFLS